jgi:hypothetical protein
MTAWLCRADLRRLRASPRLRPSCPVAIVNSRQYIAPPCDFQEGTLQAPGHKPSPRLSMDTARFFSKMSDLDEVGYLAGTGVPRGLDVP